MCNWRVNAFLIICLLTITPRLLLAGENELLAVINEHQPLHQKFIAQLKSDLKQLGAENVHIKVIALNDWQPDIMKQFPLTLMLGNRATLKLSQEKFTNPVLFSLVPSETYREIMTSTALCQTSRCGVIFIDQPLNRVLTLTRLAMPELETIGILHDHAATERLSALTSLATKHHFTIERQQISDNDNLIYSLSRVLQKSDVLLSLPDPDIYTRHTVQNILLTAYHYRKPVIGYSHNFVKAGALFAVYSSLPELSRQAAETIDGFFNKHAGLPAIQYPRYFSVSVNRMVAKSLGIKIDDEITLLKKLKAATHE